MLLIEPLREHAPFDEMEPEALEFLARKLSLGYYACGEVVTEPARGVVGRLYIVKQGRVSAADGTLGPGECFPVGALIGRRATTDTYRAEADTFCWELDAADFYALLERSGRFRAFCTDHLAMLLGRSAKRLRAEAGEALIDGAGMLAPLKSVLQRGPVSCKPETPVREVLAAMRRLGIAKTEMCGHGFRAMARTILDEVLNYRVDWIEHQLAHAVPVVAIEARQVVGERGRVHRDFGMRMRPEQPRALHADGPVAQRGALGGTRDDPDVLRHDGSSP